MSKKKDPILIALAACPEKWNEFLLKTYGLPQEPKSTKEISESEFHDEGGHQISLEAVAGSRLRLGEEGPKGLEKVCAEYSGLESQPTDEWKRCQAFMRVMAQIYAHEYKLTKEQRAALLKMVEELRPDELLVRFPEKLGSADNFLYRWQHHEFDVHFEYKNRMWQHFKIVEYKIPLPPDDPDDFDEAGEPKGHWDGLKWIGDSDTSSS